MRVELDLESVRLVGRHKASDRAIPCRVVVRGRRANPVHRPPRPLGQRGSGVPHAKPAGRLRNRPARRAVLMSGPAKVDLRDPAQRHVTVSDQHRSAAPVVQPARSQRVLRRDDPSGGVGQPPLAGVARARAGASTRPSMGESRRDLLGSDFKRGESHQHFGAVVVHASQSGLCDGAGEPHPGQKYRLPARPSRGVRSRRRTAPSASRSAPAAMSSRFSAPLLGRFDILWFPVW